MQELEATPMATEVLLDAMIFWNRLTLFGARRKNATEKKTLGRLGEATLRVLRRKPKTVKNIKMPPRLCETTHSRNRKNKMKYHTKPHSNSPIVIVPSTGIVSSLRGSSNWNDNWIKEESMEETLNT